MLHASPRFLRVAGVLCVACCRRFGVWIFSLNVIRRVIAECFVEIASVADQDHRFGMLRQPFAEQHDGWFFHVWDFFTHQLAGDGCECAITDGVPDALRGSIVEYEGGFVGIPGRSEACFCSVNFTSVDHGQFYEWSPPYRHRLAADDVVYKLVIVQQTDWVGADIASDRIPDYPHIW